MTVILVRRIAELAYAKYGDLRRTDDLGPILGTRLETFLDGAWYEAITQELGSKLKAKKEYQRLKWSKQVVMTDFRVSDLWDVFGVEGLCQEYWWASATMRAIGKDSIVRWESDKTPPLRYKDNVNPLCFSHYDARSRREGFGTRLGTWMDTPEGLETTGVDSGDQIYFAQLIPNPEIQEYPVWNSDSKSIARGLGATNFGVGVFSLARYKAEHSFMLGSFKDKHDLNLEVVLFAVWAASFFAVFTGLGAQLPKKEQRTERTLANWTNLQFRGYTMVNLDLDQFAQEAVHWATRFQQDTVFSVEDVRRGVDFISLSERGQKTIGLWSGGRRPILIPSIDKNLMIDLAAIMPFLETIFFGTRKGSQVSGGAFEESVRTALSARGLEVCLKGTLRWTEGNPREVDAAVRIGDRLVLLECFAYELPVDYEVGKPSVISNRRKFVEKKVEQARSLSERLTREPKGTNFDVTWARKIDWRVASPFIEFAWHFKEPLFDDAGVPRVLAVPELIDFLVNGTVPAAAYLTVLKKMRDFEPTGRWY